ncbi:hypothetical protein KCP74_15340 [Salmonella enterica subsp. enterica]|nr:hypothetical protein KCP74_15340 [Salmonella enterica subsp. enterica]
MESVCGQIRPATDIILTLTEPWGRRISAGNDHVHLPANAGAGGELSEPFCF